MAQEEGSRSKLGRMPAGRIVRRWLKACLAVCGMAGLAAADTIVFSGTISQRRTELGLR